MKLFCQEITGFSDKTDAAEVREAVNRAVEDPAEQIPKLLSVGVGVRLRARVVPDGDLPHGGRSAVNELVAKVSGDMKASPDPSGRR